MGPELKLHQDPGLEVSFYFVTNLGERGRPRRHCRATACGQRYRHTDVTVKEAKQDLGWRGDSEVLIEGDVGNRERPVELCAVQLVRPFQNP